MRYIILMGMLSIFLFSIGVECDKKKKVYTAPNAMTEVCEESNNTIEVYLSTSGSNYHSCNLIGFAEKKDDVFVIEDNNCTVELKFEDNSVDLEFKSDCSLFCGQRAWWISGEQKLEH